MYEIIIIIAIIMIRIMIVVIAVIFTKKKMNTLLLGVVSAWNDYVMALFWNEQPLKGSIVLLTMLCYVEVDR